MIKLNEKQTKEVAKAIAEKKAVMVKATVRYLAGLNSKDEISDKDIAEYLLKAHNHEVATNAISFKRVLYHRLSQEALTREQVSDLIDEIGSVNTRRHETVYYGIATLCNSVRENASSVRNANSK